MFKIAFTLCFVYLQILDSNSRITSIRRQSFTNNLVYQKYRNPYSTCACNKNTYHSSKIPTKSAYKYENVKFRIGAFPYNTKGTKEAFSYYTKGSKKAFIYNKKGRKPPTTMEPIITTASQLYEDEMKQFNKKVITLKVASIFRNNLIKVFGYILHRPEMELNSELYTSLYFILYSIKLNQVNIISIVPVLKELSFKTSKERFLKIFEEMEKHFPMHLKCAAAFWKDAIQLGEVNMIAILKPTANGPLKVNLFDELNDELLHEVAPEEKVHDITNEEKKILYNFNIDTVQIMRYIKKHKNKIQQIFFGALLLYFPRNSIQPDLEESIQIVVEFLEENDVEKWDTYVAMLNVAKADDPYTVVRIILNDLITSEEPITAIKESIQIILNNLENRNPTAINPSYNSIASLVEPDKVKLDYLLNYIVKGAFPTEVYLAAQRTIIYYNKGYIKHITLFANFIPYLYSTTTEIFIALLDRIIKRQPDLPTEIIDSVGAIYGNLVFTYRYIMLPVTIPDDMYNLNILFLGVRSPDIEQNFIENVNTIGTLMQEQTIDFQKILSEMPVYKAATPMITFNNFLVQIVKMEQIFPKLNVVIQQVLQTDCLRDKCRIEIRPTVNNSLIQPEVITRFYNKTLSDAMEPTTAKEELTGGPTLETTTVTTTPTTTVLTTLTQPTEGPIFSPTTLKTTTAAPPTTVSVQDIPVNATQIPYEENPNQAIITVVQKIAADQDTVWVKQIITVMEKPEFKAKLMKMRLSRKTIIITSIVQLLEMAMANTAEEAESTIGKFLRTFLSKIEHIEQILKLITTEKQPTRPVLARLIVAIPTPKDNEMEMFKQLSLLLQREELFTIIVNNIKKENYKNIGALLKAVLHEEIKLKQKLTVKELEAAKYYVNKVQMLGFGQGKILWGVDVDVISQNIKIDVIMDHAIGFNGLSRERRIQFNSIIRYLREHPPILQTWDKWIYYTKCGDFTKAIFYLLATQGSTPPNIKAAVMDLTPLINYDGNGNKPTFGE